ncbi:MAG TPA: carboxypeptidase-like regulatory domain-containing protein [Candidatus Angelobacter sp.]
MLLFLLLASIAMAQGPGSYPTITGTVTDSEGAVIPGVEIIAVNVDRHITLKATTNQAGTFSFAPLALGHYVIQTKSRKWISKEPVKVTIEISSNVNLDLKVEARHGKK